MEILIGPPSKFLNPKCFRLGKKDFEKKIQY